MHSLTKNESKILDFLIRHFNERNSINEIGRRLDISHTGVHKILRKMEKLNIVKPEKIGQAIYYKVNLEDEIAVKMAEFVLVQNELNKYAKVQAEDLKQLKETTLTCMLYGSVIKKGRQARDIDVMLIIEKEKFKDISNKLDEIGKLKPKKIHDLMMTKKDLTEKLSNEDKVVLDILKTGKILWGSEVIVEAIKNATA